MITLQNIADYLEAILEDGCTGTGLGEIMDIPEYPIVVTHDDDTCPIHETEGTS